MRIKPELTFSDMGDKVVIWDPDNSRAIVVNHTGWFVLSLIEAGVQDVGELARVLAEEYGVDPDEALRDVKDFLDQMIKEGVICE